MIINMGERFCGEWIYNNMSFSSLEELKEELKALGKEKVRLYEIQEGFDDSPCCMTGNIKVDSLNNLVVNWLSESPDRFVGPYIPSWGQTPEVRQILIVCGKPSTNLFSNNIASLMKQGVLPKAGYRGLDSVFTTRLDSDLCKKNAPSLFLRLSSSESRLFVKAKNQTCFSEITDIGKQLNLLSRFLFESNVFRQWALLVLGKQFSRNRIFPKHEIEIASHLLMFMKGSENIKDSFIWTTLLSAFQLNWTKNVSLKTFYEALKANRPQTAFDFTIAKRHKKILTKIYTSLQGKGCSMPPATIFKYLFFGHKFDRNQKHITRLSHAKKISVGMIDTFMSISDRLTVTEIARLKSIYDPEEINRAPKIHASINFLLENGYNLDSLANKTLDEIQTHENEFHQRAIIAEWKRAQDEVFPEPLKPGIPGLIEYIPSQYELDIEGEEMQHCVASYGSACLSGEIAIYRVFGKQRCTLAVDNASGKIKELCGYCNKEPKKSTKKLVQDWLAGKL